METQIQSPWQLFMMHAELPIMICNISTGKVEDTNQFGLDAFGYPLSFLKESSFSDFLVGGNPNEWEDQIQLKKAGISEKWDTKVVCRQNEIKSVEIRLVELQEADDLCLIIIKEQKSEDQKIRELKKQLSFYETILMQMPTEFAVLNAKWQYLFVNHNSIKDPEFRKWMIGKTDYDFCRYRGKDYSIAESRHKQYNELARTKTKKEWIDEHITADGTTKYVLRKLHPYFIDGELQMNFGFGIDITERINAEKEREKILRDMTIQNEELKQFAHITSHDLKEPLRTIASFTNILKRKYAGSFDAKGNEYMQFVVDSADRMGNLLTGLRSFVTVDLDRIEEKITDVDTQKAVEDALANLKLRIEETNTTFVLPSSYPIIKGHPQFFTQLLQNLILNAIKFCKKVPEIKIDWTEQADFFQFSVEDNGIGIDDKYKERIFKLFNRLDRGNYEGTGVGLAICKKVIQLHHGSMWVESDGQSGSTFFFTVKKDYRT